MIDRLSIAPSAEDFEVGAVGAEGVFGEGAVEKVINRSRFGDVSIDAHGKVCSFLEKTTTGRGLINAGIYRGFTGDSRASEVRPIFLGGVAAASPSQRGIATLRGDSGSVHRYRHTRRLQNFCREFGWLR